MEKQGKALYDLLLELSGLDIEEIKPTLDRLLIKLDLKMDSLTEDNIRQLILLYLEELNESMTGVSEPFPEEDSFISFSDTPKA